MHDLKWLAGFYKADWTNFRPSKKITLKYLRVKCNEIQKNCMFTSMKANL